MLYAITLLALAAPGDPPAALTPPGAAVPPVAVTAPAARPEPPASAVQVRHRRGDATGQGSGTCIASESGTSLILTNRHVAPDPGDAITVRHRVTEYPAEWVAAADAELTDLALVLVRADIPAAPVAASAPAPGTRVRQWGYPGGVWTPKAGTVVALGYDGAVTTTIPTAPGDSGAGVFDDAGELVAVGWGGRGGVQFAVPLPEVRTFVRVRSGPRFPRLRAMLDHDRGQPVEVVPAKPAVPAPKAGVCGCPSCKCGPACGCDGPPAAKTAPAPVKPAAPGQPYYVLPPAFGSPNCPGGNCPNVPSYPRYRR